MPHLEKYVSLMKEAKREDYNDVDVDQDILTVMIVKIYVERGTIVEAAGCKDSIVTIEASKNLKMKVT